jgi:phosphoribosylglycinamide formyltransferase-1
VKNIAVLVSGGGTNLQALIDAQNSGRIKSGKISCVISSKQDAYALTRAANSGIKTAVVARGDYATFEEYDIALAKALQNFNIDVVVLAGFLTILGENVIKVFENRIINIHPALIPSFCGKGFYGLKVHQAALERGVKLTGATAHFVTLGCDEGPIISQKAVEVLPNDTPEALQKRVMEQAEWVILPQAVEIVCSSI